MTPYEIHMQETYLYIRLWLVIVGIVAAVVPFLLPDAFVPFAGFAFMGIGFVYHFVLRKRLPNLPEKDS